MTAREGFHYIGGSWRGDAPNGMCDVINPGTGGLLGRVPHGSTALAEEALGAARAAFEAGAWASDPRLRAKVLLAFADVLEARQEEIAALMARENGTLFGQAMHEVAAGFGEARYYAGVARNVFGRTFESGPGK